MLDKSLRFSDIVIGSRSCDGTLESAEPGDKIACGTALAADSDDSVIASSHQSGSFKMANGASTASVDGRSVTEAPDDADSAPVSSDLSDEERLSESVA
jgi:hypothetical protein